MSLPVTQGGQFHSSVLPNLHSSSRSNLRTCKHDPAPVAPQPSGAPLPLCPAPPHASARGPRPPSAGGHGDPAGAARKSQRRVPRAGFKRQQQSPWPPSPRKLPGTKNNSSEPPSGGEGGYQRSSNCTPGLPETPRLPGPEERRQKVPLTGPRHGSLRQRRAGLRGGAVGAAGLSAAKAGALLPSGSPHARPAHTCGAA